MNRDGDNLDPRKEDGDASDALFADLSRLRQLAQALPPREPEETAWNAVLVCIHESAGDVRSPRPWWPIVAGAAAAVILALLLAQSFWPKAAPVAASMQRVEEPLPVAEAGDVTILSMDARDVAALVVGEPPVCGAMPFARPEDIHVIRCERCPHSGRRAELVQGGEVPMFVAAALEPPHDD
jgi:hypothetical protein